MASMSGWLVVPIAIGTSLLCFIFLMPSTYAMLLISPIMLTCKICIAQKFCYKSAVLLGYILIKLLGYYSGRGSYWKLGGATWLNSSDSLLQN